MKMTFVITLAILTISISVYAAQIDINTYIKSNKSETQYLHSYISGLGEGYMYANAELIVDDKQPLFCQPEGIVLNVKNYLQIINDEIKSGTLNNGKNYPGNIPIAAILLKGLERVFPCHHGASEDKTKSKAK